MTPGEIVQLMTAFAALGGAIAATAAAISSWHNGNRIHEVHLSLNSRLEALLSATREAGVASGRELQKLEASETQRR